MLGKAKKLPGAKGAMNCRELLMELHQRPQPLRAHMLPINPAHEPEYPATPRWCLPHSYRGHKASHAAAVTPDKLQASHLNLSRWARLQHRGCCYSVAICASRRWLQTRKVGRTQTCLASCLVEDPDTDMNPSTFHQAARMTAPLPRSTPTQVNPPSPHCCHCHCPTACTYHAKSNTILLAYIIIAPYIDSDLCTHPPSPASAWSRTMPPSSPPYSRINASRTLSPSVDR
jgi:hypothetical protein